MTDGSSLPSAPSFRIRKIGHVVLRARDLGKSVDFYTCVLGFRVPETVPGEWRWAHTLEEALANPPPGSDPCFAGSLAPRAQGMMESGR